jgi:hypothetical protein
VGSSSVIATELSAAATLCSASASEAKFAASELCLAAKMSETAEVSTAVIPSSSLSLLPPASAGLNELSAASSSASSLESSDIAVIAQQDGLLLRANAVQMSTGKADRNMLLCGR